MRSEFQIKEIILIIKEKKRKKNPEDVDSNTMAHDL